MVSRFHPISSCCHSLIPLSEFPCSRSNNSLPTPPAAERFLETFLLENPVSNWKTLSAMSGQDEWKRRASGNAQLTNSSDMPILICLSRF